MAGQITALGVTDCFAFLGPLNVEIYASINTALTTSAAALAATVVSGTGLAAGIAVNSKNVPRGTVATVVSSTNLTLFVPPAATLAEILAGTDAAAIFTGAGITWTGTVQLERSFDGGATFTVCNIGSTGVLAQWTAGPINISFGEPERMVLYRLNCIAYSSGTINYRMSQSGQATSTLSLPLLA